MATEEEVAAREAACVEALTQVAKDLSAFLKAQTAYAVAAESVMKRSAAIVEKFEPMLLAHLTPEKEHGC